MLFKTLTSIAILSFVTCVLSAPLPKGPGAIFSFGYASEEVNTICTSFGIHSSKCKETVSATNRPAVIRRNFLGDLWDTVTSPIKAVMKPIQSLVGVAENLPIVGGLVKGVIDFDSAMPWMMPFNAITGGIKPQEAMAQYDGSYMCQLKGGGKGAFDQQTLDMFRDNWKDGITKMNLENSRMQVCSTPNLSDAEVEFFNDQLANPTILTPHEGAFTAAEEARYQERLPNASADQKKTVLEALKSIPHISQHEVELITDAANGKPATVRPDDGMAESESEPEPESNPSPNHEEPVDDSRDI